MDREDTKRRRFFVNRVLRWGRDNLRDFPWRREATTVFQVLMAEMLLRKTTSVQVSSVYPVFLASFPDPQTLERASDEILYPIVRPLGLASQRMAALRAVARILSERGMPTSYEDLAALPNVGQYISAAVSCFALRQRRAIVDSNVIRLYSRFFGIQGPSDNRRNNEVARLASEVLPVDRYITFNYSLLDFAAAVCVGRGKPHCVSCTLQEQCEHVRATQACSDDVEG